jgi:hypothetical protein
MQVGGHMNGATSVDFSALFTAPRIRASRASLRLRLQSLGELVGW